jgi:hypothetical protein
MSEPRLPAGLTPRLLSVDQAAAYLGISANHFERHVAATIAAVSIGSRRLYDVKVLDRFVDGRAVMEEDKRPNKYKLLGALDGNPTKAPAKDRQ